MHLVKMPKISTEKKAFTVAKKHKQMMFFIQNLKSNVFLNGPGKLGLSNFKETHC